MTVLDVLADLYCTTPERILTVRNRKPETTARQMFFWYLAVWDGQSTRDIAEAYGWTEGTVRYGVNLTKARSRSMPSFGAECKLLVRLQMQEAV